MNLVSTRLNYRLYQSVENFQGLLVAKNSFEKYFAKITFKCHNKYTWWTVLMRLIYWLFDQLFMIQWLDSLHPHGKTSSCQILNFRWEKRILTKSLTSVYTKQWFLRITIVFAVNSFLFLRLPVELIWSDFYWLKRR